MVFVGIRSAKVIAKAFRAGFVRREALLFEWRWETCTCGAVAAVCGSWGQPEPGGVGDGGSSPDKAGVRQYCQMAWAR